MENLEIFQNDTFGEISVLNFNGRDFFPAKNCASMLGYSNPKSAITRHTKYSFKHTVMTPGGKQEVNFIPESDLFRLIVKSKLPYAEKFEKWVFEDILPTIRSKGIYATPKVIKEGLINPNSIEKLLTELNEEREHSSELIKERGTLLSTIETSKDKVHYHDVVLNNDSLITITAIAKDYGMSGIQMNKILNALKVQYKESSKWFLYQDYASKGYTHSKTIYGPTGKLIMSTYWTEKGRAFIYTLLKEKLDILPSIEK
ncbi:phage antirepressor KilAC domain-containing protein [Clostridium gasigenes]|uniref:phage antirepressor n=1 Tax=Clostridium gasigenes TaxID=94869 RepID=UPI001C0C7C9B|nr:phage antirepressor KilAC domain-containing protein [Clostridium gasigenes]MBU3136403.1 phage antirepressor KilAC domain-containing protein [Clostridium gasigenes]